MTTAALKPLPDPALPWSVPATGGPTIPFAQYMQLLDAAMQLLNAGTFGPLDAAVNDAGADAVGVPIGGLYFAQNESVLIIPISLPTLANAQVRKIAVPFDFTLLSVGFRTGGPVATAAKAATLTARVNGVAVTGGVIGLTSANQATAGALVAGSAITAGNTGSITQTVEVAISAVTAFIEGDGYVECVLASLNTGDVRIRLA